MNIKPCPDCGEFPVDYPPQCKCATIQPTKDMSERELERAAEEYAGLTKEMKAKGFYVMENISESVIAQWFKKEEVYVFDWRKLRDELNRHGISQKQLATLAECSTPFINDLVHGRRGCSGKLSIKIIEAFVCLSEKGNP